VKKSIVLTAIILTSPVNAADYYDDWSKIITEENHTYQVYYGWPDCPYTQNAVQVHDYYVASSVFSFVNVRVEYQDGTEGWIHCSLPHSYNEVSTSTTVTYEPIEPYGLMRYEYLGCVGSQRRIALGGTLNNVSASRLRVYRGSGTLYPTTLVYDGAPQESILVLDNGSNSGIGVTYRFKYNNGSSTWLSLGPTSCDGLGGGAHPK